MNDDEALRTNDKHEDVVARLGSHTTRTASSTSCMKTQPNQAMQMSPLGQPQPLGPIVINLPAAQQPEATTAGDYATLHSTSNLDINILRSQTQQVISRNAVSNQHVSKASIRSSSRGSGASSGSAKMARHSSVLETMGKKRQAEDRNEEFSREAYFNEAEQEIIRTGLSVAKQKEEADKERAAILAQRKLQDTQWAQVQERIAEEEASLLVKHAQATEAERVLTEAALQLDHDRRIAQEQVLAREAEMEKEKQRIRAEVQSEISVRQSEATAILVQQSQVSEELQRKQISVDEQVEMARQQKEQMETAAISYEAQLRDRQAEMERMQCDQQQAMMKRFETKLREKEIQMQQEFQRVSAMQAEEFARLSQEQERKFKLKECELQRRLTESATVSSHYAQPADVTFGTSPQLSSITASVEARADKEERPSIDPRIAAAEARQQQMLGQQTTMEDYKAAQRRQLQAFSDPFMTSPSQNFAPPPTLAESLRAQLNHQPGSHAHFIGDSSDIGSGSRPIDRGRPPTPPMLRATAGEVGLSSQQGGSAGDVTPAASMAGVAPLLEMERELKAEVGSLRSEREAAAKPKVTTFMTNEPSSQKKKPSRDNSSDSGGSLSMSSSTLRKTLSYDPTTTSGGPPGGGSGPEHGMAVIDDEFGKDSEKHRRREAEKISGIPKYPSVPEWGGWMRDVRYAISTASTSPQRALEYVLTGEQGLAPLDVPFNEEFETLSAKWGKEMRAIVHGDAKRELMVIEEQELRLHRRLLNGLQIYSWINNKFRRDAALARPQILTELTNCKIKRGGNGALAEWINRWDHCVERLIQAGAEESDKVILYVAFLPNFMYAEELQDGAVAKVKRSLPTSRVHSYDWMYAAVKATIESSRLARVETERSNASAPGATMPLTPAVTKTKAEKKADKKADDDRIAAAVTELANSWAKASGKAKGDGKGKHDGKGKYDTKNVACPRLVNGETCKYGDRCYYSHSQSTIDKAKAAPAAPAGKAFGKKGQAGGKGKEPTDKSKLLCKLFAKCTELLHSSTVSAWVQYTRKFTHLSM